MLTMHSTLMCSGSPKQTLNISLRRHCFRVITVPDLYPAAAETQRVRCHLNKDRGNGAVFNPNIGFYAVGTHDDPQLCVPQVMRSVLSCFRKLDQELPIINNDKFP